jgi:hypothetical protein
MARKAARGKAARDRQRGQVRQAAFGYYPRLTQVRQLVESSLARPVSLPKPRGSPALRLGRDELVKRLFG